jgi:16S rRNA (adenine1518-N6/adenine1519-N6)-dimethyltransferase
MQRISSISRTKEIIAKYKFRFSKSLGQNFLVDGNTIDKIIRAGNIGPDDNVLEVGPGIGTLTQMLCEDAGKVLAIEKDWDLIPILKNDTLKDYENLTILHGDILKADIKAIVRDSFGDNPFKLIANLPYYITTPIIMRFLEEDLPVTDIVIMMQKEVAERVEAVPGTKSYGALSVAVQYYAEPEIMGVVPKHVFMPAPKIDSIIIRLRVRKEPPVVLKDKSLFFETVKASFAMRRKTLNNTLRKALPYGDDVISRAIEGAGIDPIRRGETLTIDEFATLSNEIYKQIN